MNNVNQDNGKCSSIIIIAMTICCFAGDIAWIVMSFIEFQCTDAVIWQVITLVVIVLAFAVQLLGRAREDASILTTGLAALYFQYLQWAALSTSPDEDCNPQFGSGSNAAAQIGLGIAVTLFGLFMMSGFSDTGDDADKAKAAIAAEKK